MTSPRDTYLETQITTATPQRLRLMLIEAAIREAKRTAEHWRINHNDEALETLIRCRAIVGELIAGVSDAQSPLARRVLGLYGFLFTSLTEAQLTRDAARLDAVVRILEEESQTWRQVCTSPPDLPPQRQTPGHSEETAPSRVASGWPGAYDSRGTLDSSPGLSLDA
ncbi:MAG TPA: flagellar export chaperone FliS [Pirellulaceae bacterium]|nr:flagellar export chaperone FliS [Pirellulaceae bacterium]